MHAHNIKNFLNLLKNCTTVKVISIFIYPFYTRKNESVQNKFVNYLFVTQRKYELNIYLSNKSQNTKRKESTCFQLVTKLLNC